MYTNTPQRFCWDSVAQLFLLLCVLRTPHLTNHDVMTALFHERTGTLKLGKIITRFEIFGCVGF